MANSEPKFSHLVVIGASAGGVESLSVLVSTLSPTFPAPIVVAQHMSPNRNSALGDILARRGPLPVRTISDVDPLEPGTIYVVPPNRNVMITDHEVRLVGEGNGPQPSIDLLFKSAAELFGENCIAVVLSGTGSDGAMGAREVKYAGGTVIIQNPDTAAYPGMPLSLAPSIVDIVANRERIGGLLNDLLTGEFIVPPVSEHSHLGAFLDEIREQSGIDFSSYKQPTIERRLQRRMIATSQPTMTGYVRYVQAHPEERQRLITSFLIKVTEFFRDPELYTYLGEQVLPNLIQDAHDRGGDLRIWSAGCATGEEAYSLAMTVSDALGDRNGNLSIKIFATDLDETAVAFARRGVYPARSLSGVSPEQLTRYFNAHGDDFEVKKGLRGMLVFGEHDLGQRAPFPRIDLILCRNVLIYFTAALQRRALQLFAFSLRTGGCLVLGKSESVSPLAEFFVVDQSRLKIFRRIGDRVLLPPSRIRDAAPSSSPGSTGAASPFSSVRPQRPAAESHSRSASWQSDHVLLELTLGVVVIDRNYDIHYINGEARRLFGIHTSAVEQDFIHLIRHYDPTPVRRAIDDSISSESVSTVVIQPLAPHPDAQRILEVGCSRIGGAGNEGELLIVLTAFDVTDRELLRQRQASAEEIISRLAKANDEVLAANQDLTYSISRLRAENEELMVVTEEIQAATEEVETLNEELQASNEELETVNEELHATVEELNTTNDDLESRTLEVQTLEIAGDSARHQRGTILDGVEDGIVVVNATESIIIENAAYKAFAAEHLMDTIVVDEAGKQIAAKAMPVQRAARGEHFSMTIAYERSGTRRWYRARGNPVSTERGGALGVVTIREMSSPE